MQNGQVSVEFLYTCTHINVNCSNSNLMENDNFDNLGYKDVPDSQGTHYHSNNSNGSDQRLV